MLNTWWGSPSIGNIINSEIPWVSKFSRLSISKTPGLNMLARLNNTGPLPFEFTWRWKMSWSPNLNPNVNSIGNSAAPEMGSPSGVLTFNTKTSGSIDDLVVFGVLPAPSLPDSLALKLSSPKSALAASLVSKSIRIWSSPKFGSSRLLTGVLLRLLRAKRRGCSFSSWTSLDETDSSGASKLKSATSLSFLAGGCTVSGSSSSVGSI